MTKSKEFPAMKWHPETGVPEVFHTAQDVPDGYLDCHPNSLEAKKASQAAAGNTNQLPMTKAEIVEALKAGNIEFKPNQGAKALYDILEAALREHLTANKVEIPEGANVPALLALANPKSE